MLASLSLGLVLALPQSASAVEVVVQNDSVVDGSQVAVQTGFIAGESAAAWLTSPCDGTIVAVQVWWSSATNGEPASVEDSITIFRDGPFPTPGVIAEELIAPLMTPGFLNEFRFLDQNNTIPLAVPVSEGETFVVSFKFATSPVPFVGPSVATDTDGCQNGKNSIFCLGGICNGWTNSCSLFISGDFFIRAVVDCDSIDGACCLETGSCIEDTEANCLGADGQFQGNASTCGEVECVVPEEACCFFEPFPQCFDLTPADCAIAQGVTQGFGTDCTNTSCEPPVGACCFDPKGCVDLEEDDCTVALGTWGGDGTDCGNFVCNPMGACCMPDGMCVDGLAQDACESAAGVFQGDGTLCAKDTCPQPLGACCIVNGGCIEGLPEDTCMAIPTSVSWGGADSDCTDADMSGIADACELGCASCAADCGGVGDGQVDVVDLLALLSQWNGPGSCDIQPDAIECGDGAVDVVDLLTLLAMWGSCP